ncbi:hypothetical protein MNBD_ALPHA07-2430 [hydrothermal vent metagenome]|uniref:Uncharacterized protein n=1 Tax=hydrothermal vent metagenome TaxID=652676 RepID=A0A3B0R6A0_9ZZZZ
MAKDANSGVLCRLPNRPIAGRVSQSEVKTTLEQRNITELN